MGDKSLSLEGEILIWRKTVVSQNETCCPELEGDYRVVRDGERRGYRHSSLQLGLQSEQGWTERVLERIRNMAS